MKRSRKSGFTLVELMVVAIIVAILAAVAIPLMSANRYRAIATEAEAGCGTVRTALRANYAQCSSYVKDADGNTISTPTQVPGIGASDLDGKYFKTADYSFTSLGSTNYTIQAKSTSGDANGVTITLDQGGNWVRTFPN